MGEKVNPNKGSYKKRLVWFLEHAFFPATVALIVFYFSYYIEFHNQKDQFVLNLKLSLPYAKSTIEENIKNIQTNRSNLQTGILSLDTIDQLPSFDLNNIKKYVEDTNVVISLNFTNQCFNSYNSLLHERNAIYSSLIDGHPINSIFLDKERRLEALSPKCLEWLAKAQCQLHLIYAHKAKTKIKSSDCHTQERDKMQ